MTDEYRGGDAGGGPGGFEQYPAGANTPAAIQPPGAGMRLIGYLIDGFAVGIPLQLVLLALTWGDVSQFDALYDGWWIALLSTVLFVLMRVLCEARWGASPGKWVIRARVVSEDGLRRPTARESGLRNLWNLALGIPFEILAASIFYVLAIVIGVGISRRPGDRRSMMDRFSGTRVVHSDQYPLPVT